MHSWGLLLEWPQGVPMKSTLLKQVGQEVATVVMTCKDKPLPQLPEQ